MAKDIHTVDDLTCFPEYVLLFLASHNDNGDVVRLGMACSVVLYGCDELVDDLGGRCVLVLIEHSSDAIIAEHVFFGVHSFRDSVGVHNENTVFFQRNGFLLEDEVWQHAERNPAGLQAFDSGLRGTKIWVVLTRVGIMNLVVLRVEDGIKESGKFLGAGALIQ